jgi:Xaa-Pro dipeptidase
MSQQHQERLQRLRGLARSGGYDAIALVPGPELAYVTGLFFHLSTDRPMLVIVPTDERTPVAIVPKLEESRLKENAAYPITPYAYGDAEGYVPAFERAIQSLHLNNLRVGVEGLRMRVLEAQLFEEIATGSRVHPADETILQLRLRKTPDEVALMRQAIQISQDALDRTLDGIDGKVIGMTELQITNLLLNNMTEAGGGGNPFDPIVLTGANSALPHGHPGSTVVQEGDLLLFDFGTKVQGYPSDITRTFAVGSLDEELRRVYDTVLAANRAGVAAGRPGVTAQDVDRATRRVITEAGLGEYFTHRTGHGLGLDIHEHPNMREGNTMVLESGMIYTVEPGVYLPGRGGVRIEDDIVVTENGVESLTTYPRELRVLRG